MEMKTLLNPNATPFLPLSQRYSEVKGESKVVGETLSCQKVDCDSVDYNVQSEGELPVSDVSSSSYDFEDDAFLDEIALFEKHGMMDAEFDRMMESLSDMYPDLSVDSIAASLRANDGDLDATIDMLEQLEDEGDIPEASNKDGSQKP